MFDDCDVLVETFHGSKNVSKNGTNFEFYFKTIVTPYPTMNYLRPVLFFYFFQINKEVPQEMSIKSAEPTKSNHGVEPPWI
jgi:hypothetical protein